MQVCVRVRTRAQTHHVDALQQALAHDIAHAVLVERDA
jgi:hypothetical protein